MQCPQCQNEWTPPPDECPNCQALAATPALLAPPPLENVPPMGIHAPYHQEDMVTPQTSGWAIATLILGLLSCTLVAFVLGIIALVQISKSRGQLKGLGMAITGMLCSCVLPVCLMILIPVVVKANKRDQETLCMSNQRQIAMVTKIWAQDNDEMLPSANAFWKDVDMPAHFLICSTKPEQSVGYGFNRHAGGMAIGAFADPTTALLTADSNAANQLISGKSDIDGTRHNGGYISSYLDGHVAWCTTDQLVILIQAR